MIAKKISSISAVSALFQLSAYIFVPYSLGFFSLDSISTYSIILATAAPFSVLISYYSDSSILADPKSADLISSLAHITLNTLFCLFIVLLFLQLPIASTLYSHTLVLLTALISYQISINKILGSHLIIHRHHRLARLSGCTMPILLSILQLIFCFVLKIPFLSSLVLGNILSLVIVNAIIFLYLLRKINLSAANKYTSTPDYRVSHRDTAFSPKALPYLHCRFLTANFPGTLGLFFASVSTSSLSWLLYSFCGNEMAAHFFVALKLFSPISTINSVWLIPKTLSVLLCGTDRGYACRIIRTYSLALIVMTLLCSLTLIFIKFLPFASPSATLANIPFTVILLLFISTASQQVSILCTLPQITASRTGLILIWQSLLIAVIFISALLVHLIFNHLPGSSSLQILLVASSSALVYTLWAWSSYSYYSSFTYE